jgi:thioredoxin-like negative regulator of GroEL
MTKTIDLGTQSPDDVKGLMVTEERPILMLYRMHMCPHCVALQPAWTDVRKRLLRDKGVVVAEVEYRHMGVLPSSLRNIRGFPTIQIIQKGRVRDEYAGDRTPESIVEFARSFSAPPPKPKKAETAPPKAKAVSKASKKPQKK